MHKLPARVSLRFHVPGRAKSLGSTARAANCIVKAANAAGAVARSESSRMDLRRDRVAGGPRKTRLPRPRRRAFARSLRPQNAPRHGLLRLRRASGRHRVDVRRRGPERLHRRRHAVRVRVQLEPGRGGHHSARRPVPVGDGVLPLEGRQRRHAGRPASDLRRRVERQGRHAHPQGHEAAADVPQGAGRGLRQADHARHEVGVDLVDAKRGEPGPPVQRRALHDLGAPAGRERTGRRREALYAARRSYLRALRAQASRAPCAQANEPRLRPRQTAMPTTARATTCGAPRWTWASRTSAASGRRRTR